MANYFISGHGTLDPAAGKFVVPTGTTIYFFNPPDMHLESRYSDFFLGQLCNDLISPTAEAYVRALSVEVAPEGELVPNYLAMGSDLEFCGPSGVYLVGQPTTKGPVVRLLDGVKRTLKDLVSGISDGGSIGTHVYWGVSRRDGRARAGSIPRQYFDRVAQRDPRLSKSGKASRYRSLGGHSSPLGSAGFVLERFGDPVDYMDFPKFREFKASLTTGEGLFGRKLV